MRRTSIPLLAAVLASFAAPIPPASGQLAPPAPGATLPSGYRETLRDVPGAFQMRRAWIQKAQRARDARRQLADIAVPARYDGTAGPGGAASLHGATATAAATTAVTGTFHVPVFLTKFANTPEEPYAPQLLEQELFGGGTGTETLSDFYDEVSGGRIQVVGNVYGWHQLPNDDTWYEGTSNGTNPLNAHIGELLYGTLMAYDPSVDFGQYDNDGPDGVPNSGDDDGYVDFVAFVHPERGAECGGNSNIWSHRWTYRAWSLGNGMPFVTGDPAARGGTILIDDYTIQPGLSCAPEPTCIEIGVFCHEFGHAFGLPDLYDVNGGSAGLGHWCLMASGNWNEPASPAHMGAWAKRELGWVDVVGVSWQGTVLTVPPVESAGLVYQMEFGEDRWRRRTDCPIAGEASLGVGLTSDESTARGWVSPQGYGNAWRETVAHDFHFDGTGPVTLSYQYAIHSEELYDYAFAEVEVAGVPSQIAIYDGVRSGVASFDITSLLGTGPVDYRVKFRFTSDIFFSNEDGHYPATCSPFRVDDVRVEGGGEHHIADFEAHIDGWYQPDTQADNPPSEVWLVENRQAEGYDSKVHGMGLLVTHIDQEVIDSGNSNTGGRYNNSVHGVAVEEADGLGHLSSGANRGDDGDVFPGTSGNVSFTALSSPASVSNSGHPTRVSLTDITQNGQDLVARFAAGDPPPTLAAALPETLAVAAADVSLELVGEQGVRHGAVVHLTREGGPNFSATRVLWLDSDRVSASFDLTGAPAGDYDVVLENPDGQTAVAATAVHLASGATATPTSLPLPAGYRLAQNAPNPFNPVTVIRFEMPAPARVRIDVVDVRGRVVRNLLDEALPAGYHSARWDGTDAAGTPVASGLYLYRMAAGSFVQQKKLLLLK